MKTHKRSKKTIVLLYHYFYPDTVASGRYFVQLAESLTNLNYQVIMLTSNRKRMEPRALIHPKQEYWKNIQIIRVHRPAWNQSRNLPRLVSSFIVMAKWLKEISKLKNVDSFVLGTNPELSQLLFPFIRLVQKKSNIYYWCFDLFPEAILANKKSLLNTALGYLITPALNLCYKYCDGILDLGHSMRRHLQKYPSVPPLKTITPWALVEPIAPKKEYSAFHNHKLFGTAELKILYSGTLAKGHKFKPLVQLARYFRSKNISSRVVFACQGQRKSELENYILPEDKNIAVKDFLPEEELDDYLSTPDFIAVSIEEGWDGILLPSKFFGALAMGKPVLFIGSHHNEMAKWIKQYRLGVCLSGLHEIEKVSSQLLALKNEPEALKSLGNRCYSIYQQKFSRAAGVHTWDRLFQVGPSFFKQEVPYQLSDISKPSLQQSK